MPWRTKILGWFMSAWDWIQEHVVGLVAAVVAVLGAGWAWGYHRRKVRSLKDQIAIKEAHRRVAALDAERVALAERADENRERIAAIESERKAIRDRTAALEHDVETMSDDEVERAFRAMY